MPDISPRERLLALYQRIAELRVFRETEDAQMTPEERRESDAVIADLLAAARELKAEHRLEIWTEEFAEILGRMVASQKDTELYTLVGDDEAANEARRKAQELSVLCGLMIGEMGGGHAEDSA